MPSALVPVIIVVAAVVTIAVLFRFMWRISEPNKAMIISGLSSKSEGTDGPGPRIIVGRGALIIPFIQQVRTLGLNQHSANLEVECVTSQGIPVRVLGVVLYKVANDFRSIANAAQRFLNQEQQMDTQVHNVFASHLREIVGNLTVEQLISDRKKLGEQLRENAVQEIGKLGLQIDSLNIQEIDDPTRYIENLSQPHIAAVQKTARIAKADNDREASQREAEAQALVAQAHRDSEIKQAGFHAEVQKANATAEQAGPLADATARQAVVEQETRVATLTAQRTEAELAATVLKQADANAYATAKSAEAERQAAIYRAEAESESIKLRATADADQTRLVGQAQGEAIAARGKAEGDALKARADGLAANQDAVISQQVAERLPEIVAAAAKIFDGVDHVNVLNGAAGVYDMMAQVIAQGTAILHSVREQSSNGNGHALAPSPPPTPPVTPPIITRT